ncbi:hypothetical protein [Niastella populi]|nr:hypothetical protein [Niastella populi]
MNQRVEPYAAMLIPVKLPGCPKRFYMQFDVGAPYSVFYRNKIQTIGSRYPLSAKVNDSTMRLNEFSFLAGNTKIMAHEIVVKPLGNPQINWKRDALEIIGTLGIDFIGNNTISIDYPAKKIRIGYKLPDNQPYTLTDLIYTNNTIIFPASIKGKKTMLLFDSGSSAFELLTSEQTAATLAVPGTVPAIYPVSSWGRILTATSYASNDSIEIASVKIPLNRVAYIEGASDGDKKRMMQMGIGGLTGNRLFLQSILVLDLAGKRFGIIKGKARQL